jgi:hypothetical protein
MTGEQGAGSSRLAYHGCHAWDFRDYIARGPEMVVEF